MALTTTPTIAAQNANQVAAAQIRDTVLPLAYVHDIATPTFRLLWEHKKVVPIGPDAKIRGNLFHGSANAFVGTQSMQFPQTVKDNLTQMEYDAVITGSSNTINIFEQTDYSGPMSNVDLAMARVDEMHRGLTEAINYSLWSGFGANGTTEVVGGQINLDTFMAHSPGVLITGEVGTNALRLNSLPMCIRSDVDTAGTTQVTNIHTFGNISSANVVWRSVLTEYGTVTYTDAAANAQNGIPSAIASPQAYSGKMLTDLLDDMQIGGNFGLYVAMPPKIFSSAVRELHAQQRGDMKSPLTHLGINKAIEHPSYNATLYAEPAMKDSDMWPNSIYVWDPEAMFLCVDGNYMPRIFPWQPVGWGTILGVAELIRGQLVIINRPATGVIHGVTDV